jgi:DNA repair exonuclease SbcCD ATPase subunit
MEPPAKCADVDSSWLDEMMTKLQRELERQLERVGTAKAEADDHRERAADARTLEALERTLERLAKLERERTVALERERTVAKEKKIAKHGAEGTGHAALERRLDKRLAGVRTKDAAGKSDG